ncbi:hypothetical protein [Aliarcobacter butzleri]|uniref:hypothetical protein n=1 Tax=Aliarcobacter butzleri TaxID=28197 RepID=UPI0021B3AF7A|nr:hypothetical protein [Aliarcobacter butzleri]MCT7577319.1 hypothetical protein [Aliarcobacter butzleri]
MEDLEKIKEIHKKKLIDWGISEKEYYLRVGIVGGFLEYPEDKVSIAIAELTDGFLAFLLSEGNTIITQLMSNDIKIFKEGYELFIEISLYCKVDQAISLLALGKATNKIEKYTLKKQGKNIKGYNFKYNDNEISSDIYSIEKILNNFFNYSKLKVKRITDEQIFQLIPNEIKQEAIEESFKMIQEKLKNMKLGKYKDIDLTKYLKNNIQNINDSSEFEVHKDYMNEIFKNPQITSRLYKKDKPHFMNKLSNDNLAYCKDTDSFYFKGLEESLFIAYTDKYLLINIDKQQAIKGLNEALKGLEILTNDEVEKQKTFIKELINLINNTNTNYYTFKVIGKALGMNKNEARNYCKSILSRDLRSINKITFDKYYDE